MGLQKGVISEKTVFRHFYPLKVVQELAFRSDTTYNNLPGGWKVADHKIWYILFFKKMQ